MKRFPKAASGHMKGFLNGAAVDSLPRILVYCLQRLSETCFMQLLAAFGNPFMTLKGEGCVCNGLALYVIPLLCVGAEGG